VALACVRLCVEGLYVAHLGAEHLPANVELGGRLIVPRPVPASDAEHAATPTPIHYGEDQHDIPCNRRD
jgi:hypothetical protein